MSGGGLNYYRLGRFSGLRRAIHNAFDRAASFLPVWN